MRRMVVLVVALSVAVAGAACDRVDQGFGERGVVRVGIAPDDLVGVPEGELVQSSFLIGHRPGTSVVEVSEVDVQGRTLFTTALPSTFTSATARGAVVGFDEPRDPDLKVDVVGFDPDGRVAVAQVDAGGLVRDYGANGVATTDVTLDRDTAPVIVASDDGRATVLGRRDGHPVITRLSPEGIVLGVTTMSDEVDLQDAVDLGDGRVLAAGTAVRARRSDGLVTDSDFAVVRYGSDGLPDATFGDHGVALVPFNGGDIDRAQSVVVRDDGRIVVAGTTVDGVQMRIALAGLTPDGRPDGSFGLYARSIADPGYPIERVDLAQGPNGFVALTEAADQLLTVGFTARGTVDDGWGDHGLQHDAPGGAITTWGIRSVALECRHGVCTGGYRYLAAAQTAASPGGALIRYTA